MKTKTVNIQRKIKFKSAFSFLLLLIFTVIVFLVEDIFFPVLGFKMPVYILVPLTVSFAMNMNGIPALFYGVLTGALFDLISAAPDGLYSLIFAVVSFAVSELTKQIFRNSRNVYYLFSSIFTLLICVISFTVNFIAQDSSSLLVILKDFYLPAFIITVVFTPLFYPVSSKIIGIKNERIQN